MNVLRTIGNLLWLFFIGWWLALAYAIAGLIMCILVITIPFGLQAFKLAGYALWPFGRTVVERRDADESLSIVGNVLWLVVAGWWLALAHLAAIVMLLVSIVGIPFIPPVARMALLSVWPVGSEVVDFDEADRRERQITHSRTAVA